MTRRPLATSKPTPDENVALDTAYTLRVEGRWWIFHWTPSGMIVRAMTTYPDKAAALGAMGTLGYRAVDPPRDPAKVQS